MVKLGVEIFFFSKSPFVGRFSIFHSKLQVFAGLGAFLGELFCHFLVIFSCKISVFCEAGRSFWVKKYTFFHAKHKFLRGWMLFLSTKTTVKAVERGGRRGASRGAILCATSLFRSSLWKVKVSEWWLFGSCIFMKLLYVIGGVLT